MRIAINGFGRIGRTVFKKIIELYPNDLEVVAINDLADNETLAYLLKYDSVHRKFPGEVKADAEHIYVNGKAIKAFAQKDPSQLPWKDLNVDVVLESTGIFTSKEKAMMHIQAGAKRVLISAPGKDEVDATLVCGVNAKEMKPEYQVVTNASCTTNAAAVMLQVLAANFEIEKVMLTTIHAYTNDQSLHDQPHRDLRRARSAAVSLIPTTSGSATDVARVLPQLEGKMTAMAVRTPNICGSLNDMKVILKNPVTPEQINAAYKQAAEGDLKGILEYTEDPIVSVDIIGNTASAIFDSSLTKVLGGNMVQIMGWYDNEMGYSTRCAELLKFMNI